MTSDAHTHHSAPAPRQIAAFEDRYGLGAHARLLKLLEQPCVTFAAIAAEFGVTRERVRQWQLLWLPGSPRGRERRKQCQRLRQRRRVLQEPALRAFYRSVRSQVPAGRLALVPARGGFRKRLVRLEGHIVFIKIARPYRHQSSSAAAYSLTTYRGDAEFVYFQLTEQDYLFVPVRELPAAGTTFLDTPGSKYQRYKNTLAAIIVPGGEPSSPPQTV